jgi:hypothetical protein
MARERSSNLTQSNVARLVEAERQWQASLEAARAAAAKRVEAVRAELAGAEPAERARIEEAVRARRLELDTARKQSIARVDDEFRDRIAIYTSADDDLVERIAHAMAERAPWFATVVVS